MDVALALGTAAPASYYIGLIGDAGFSSIANGDTMASHAGWTEETAYSQTTRPAWVDNGVSAGLVTNPAKAQFTFTAAKTVKGAFLVTNSTKGGTTGTLIGAVLFAGGDRAVASGETLKVGIEAFMLAQ